MNTQLSHVLKAIKLPEEYAKGTIRISLGKSNNYTDATVITESIRKNIKNNGANTKRGDVITICEINMNGIDSSYYYEIEE